MGHGCPGRREVYQAGALPHPCNNKTTYDRGQMIGLLRSSVGVSCEAILTGAALSSASISHKHEIISRERMPALAMSFPSVLSYWPISSEHIVSMAHRLKVLWVYTSLIVAQMIQLKTLFNWSHVQTVGGSVGKLCFSSVAKIPVLVGFPNAASPQPTIPRPIGMCQQLFFQRSTSHVYIINTLTPECQ